MDFNAFEVYRVIGKWECFLSNIEDVKTIEVAIDWVPAIDDGVRGIVKSTVPECKEAVYAYNECKEEEVVGVADWSFVSK